jgi:hypothetical protein
MEFVCQVVYAPLKKIHLQENFLILPGENKKRNPERRFAPNKFKKKRQGGFFDN